MMNVVEKPLFHFSSTIGATNFQFSIPAESREAAIKQLIAALEAMTSEAKDLLKSNTKAN